MSLSRELIVAAKARADAATEAFNAQVLEVALIGDGAPGNGTDVRYGFESDGGRAVYDFVETAARADVPVMADALLRVLDLHHAEVVEVMAQGAPPDYAGWPTVEVRVCSLCLSGRIDNYDADERDVRPYLYPCATVRAVTGDGSSSNTERSEQ